MSKYLIPIFVTLLLIVGGFGYWQFQRANDLNQELKETKEYIEDFQKNAALANELREENDRLKAALSENLKELQNVDGYNTPLPPDIRSYIDRVRTR